MHTKNWPVFSKDQNKYILDTGDAENKISTKKMQTIKIQCPAKINLNLKIVGKLENGFHSIESVMQTISLFDYLTISISESGKNEIILSGNSTEIPYNDRNLAYKAAKLYLDDRGIKNQKININIEKNIPTAAGMAGGSTDGAGVLYGLDKLFSCNPLASSIKNRKTDLDQLCAKLGSDLNVCLHGGRILACGRGEIITPMEFKPFNISLIKPKNLGISAKEAYSKYSKKIMTHNAENINKYENHLEWAIIDDYPQLQYIKQKYPNSTMTGSGSTFFMINKEFEKEQNYWIKNNLSAINYGVKEI